MKAPDLLELAVRNLRESVLRNSLTTLGIGVGVASLVAMVSLGIGLQQNTTRRLERSGLFDTVMVTRADAGGFGPRRRNASTAENQRVLDDNARRDFAALPGVLEAVPDIRTVAQIRYGDKPHRAMVAAVPMSAHDREAFENLQGSFFSSGSAGEAILQKSFAEELLNLSPEPADESEAGKPSPELQPLLGKELVMSYAARLSAPKAGSAQIASGASHSPATSQEASAPANSTDAELNPLLAAFSVAPETRTLRIVGILTADPDAVRGVGRARVFVPQDFAEGLQLMLPSDLGSDAAAGERTYLEISVRLRHPEDVPRVEESIRRMGFNAFSILDASRSVQTAFRIFDIFLAVFGSLALAVASLGIVNTLVMAILERRREIGILKALGASDMDVKLLFFVEAGAMGVVGGVLGVAMGWTIGKIINIGVNFYLHRQNVPPQTLWLVPWWLVFLAVGFSIFVSFVSGLYPAARAAKLDPVRALRYE